MDSITGSLLQDELKNGRELKLLQNCLSPAQARGRCPKFERWSLPESVRNQQNRGLCRVETRKTPSRRRLLTPGALSVSQAELRMSPAGSRTVNLLCPSLAKIVPVVVLEDRGLDLGTLARIFGIEPSTLRLNGHFISRGVNFISSVTWKSVLSFFAKKGYSTGKSSRDAVIVDGKFCDDNDRAKAGSQYSNDMGVGQRTDSGIGSKRKPWLEDVNLLKRRKLCGDGSVIEKDNLGGKRKLWQGDVNLLKRRKMERCNSEKSLDPSCIAPSPQFCRSSLDGSLKRGDGGEYLLSATPCKRIR